MNLPVLNRSEQVGRTSLDLATFGIKSPRGSVPEFVATWHRIPFYRVRAGFVLCPGDGLRWSETAGRQLLGHETSYYGESTGAASAT
jgi:hypothetical protein